MEQRKDNVALEMMSYLASCGVCTAYDRADAQQPQCGYGRLGVCCKNCNMGPCIVNPFGDDGPTCGICGADADTIAARNFVRSVAAGAAAHADHGRAVAELLIEAAEGTAPDYQIKDEKKLREVAKWFNIKPDGKPVKALAREVGEAALGEFGKRSGYQMFTKRAPKPRQELWQKLGVTPRAFDREVTESLHRTGMGTDQDYKNLIRQATRTSLADGWGGSMIATELQDVLFGTLSPCRGDFNLGVLKEENVNVIVHGHEPELSEMIALASQDPELIAEAQKAGAKGITVAGICCTANELLVRHGIPVAGNLKMQEMAIATGAVEVMVVDVQCVMAAVVEMQNLFHTRIITTSNRASITGAEHIEFHPGTALKTAKQIIRRAIEVFPKRDKNRVHIPREKTAGVVGFSVEAIKHMLGGTFRSGWRPLNDNVMNGRIRGVAGVVGCTNPRFKPDQMPYVDLAYELISNNILVVETGCAGIESGKAGLLQPEVMKHAGPGLREVCETVGIPPVLHAGSCVDNSRILVACAEIVAEGGLGKDISDLPAAGACFEWMHEKALAIGQYFVASGVFTIFGTGSPLRGAPKLEKYLTDEIEQELGGKWAFETDVNRMAQLMIDHIEKKRDALGINKEAERVLFDMEARRALEV